jgi:hypothetical protein
MHATELITPEVLLVICIGAIICVVIFMVIFRKRKP